MKTVLFFRSFKGFHGGHLKVWDYFNHVRHSAAHTPRIGFTASTRWDASNPWTVAREFIVDDWQSIRPDLFFVAGRDWRMLDHHPDRDRGIPVVNLVQHVRHADEESGRFRYLSRKAVRICVSDEVAASLRATGQVEGPIVVIPNGVDVATRGAGATAATEAAAVPASVDLLIAGLKRPDLARALAARLDRPGRRVVLLTESLPRAEFLARVERARTTLFLPNETEGFYLPALEGMGLGTLVVCPDVTGNRSYLLPGVNGFRPAYTADDAVAATEAALELPGDAADEMRARARGTAARHSLDAERAAFLALLDGIDRLW